MLNFFRAKAKNQPRPQRSISTKEILPPIYIMIHELLLLFCTPLKTATLLST